MIEYLVNKVLWSHKKCLIMILLVIVKVLQQNQNIVINYLLVKWVILIKILKMKNYKKIIIKV